MYLSVLVFTALFTALQAKLPSCRGMPPQRCFQAKCQYNFQTRICSDNGSRVEVVIGSSFYNTRTVGVEEGLICPTLVNKRIWAPESGVFRDTFEVTLDGTLLTATRTDKPFGWGMHLVIICERECAVCDQAVPECREGCEHCVVSPNNCQQCSKATCADDQPVTSSPRPYVVDVAIGRNPSGGSKTVDTSITGLICPQSISRDRWRYTFKIEVNGAEVTATRTESWLERDTAGKGWDMNVIVRCFETGRASTVPTPYVGECMSAGVDYELSKWDSDAAIVKEEVLPTASDCQDACRRDDLCTAWSWKPILPNSGRPPSIIGLYMCTLKAGEMSPHRTTDRDSVFGTMRCVDASSEDDSIPAPVTTSIPAPATTSIPAPATTSIPAPATTSIPEMASKRWARYPNAAISGHNREHLTSVSVDDCKTTCESREWCKSFDYYKANQKCDLSDASLSEVGLKTDYEGNPYDHYSQASCGHYNGDPRGCRKAGCRYGNGVCSDKPTSEAPAPASCGRYRGKPKACRTAGCQYKSDRSCIDASSPKAPAACESLEQRSECKAASCKWKIAACWEQGYTLQCGDYTKKGLCKKAKCWWKSGACVEGR